MDNGSKPSPRLLQLRRIKQWPHDLNAQFAVLQCYSFYKAHVAPYGKTGKRVDKAVKHLATEFGYQLNPRTMTRYVDELMEKHHVQEGEQDSDEDQDKGRSLEDRVRIQLDKMVREKRAFGKTTTKKKRKHPIGQHRDDAVNSVMEELNAPERDAEVLGSRVNERDDVDNESHQGENDETILAFKRRRHADMLSCQREQLKIRKKEIALKEKEAERAYELQLRRLELEQRANEQRHEEFKMLIDVKVRKLELLKKN